VLLYQLVVLKRAGEIVRLSKRSGEIITLDELVEEVGADAARFFFLLRSPGAQMEFDLDLAKKQSNENPVFYVQYAHARLAGILRRATEQGLSPEGGDVCQRWAADLRGYRGCMCPDCSEHYLGFSPSWYGCMPEPSRLHQQRNGLILMKNQFWKK
jgi:hypothetical protein